MRHNSRLPPRETHKNEPRDSRQERKVHNFYWPARGRCRKCAVCELSILYCVFYPILSSFYRACLQDKGELLKRSLRVQARKSKLIRDYENRK